MTTSYRCQDCNFVGQPLTRTDVERDGTPPPYRTSTYLYCPDCESPDVEEVGLCELCERSGYQNAVFEDDLCIKHYRLRAVLELEDECRAEKAQ